MQSADDSLVSLDTFGIGRYLQISAQKKQQTALCVPFNSLAVWQSALISGQLRQSGPNELPSFQKLKPKIEIENLILWTQNLKPTLEIQTLKSQSKDYQLVTMNLWFSSCVTLPFYVPFRFRRMSKMKGSLKISIFVLLNFVLSQIECYNNVKEFPLLMPDVQPTEVTF